MILRIASLKTKWIITVGIIALTCQLAHGETPLEKAQKLYTRIAGVKLNYDSPVLTDMATLISQGKYGEAANKALNNDDFYNVSLFNYFAPLSTRSEAADVPLNDFIAMGIANTFLDPTTGRDRPYTELVKGDFTVALNGTRVALNNNTALNTAFTARTILSPQNLTIQSGQRANFPDAAGVLTSRQFMLEHAIAGTNRRLIHFAYREFLCTDIKDWRDPDSAISDEFVRRDVPRAPGGGLAGAQQYQTECRGCHGLMDAVGGAFAYHDFDNTTGAPVYVANTVAQKINRINEFPGGHVVSSDNWENKATRNTNERRFGWRGALRGNGAKGLGEMIANAQRFSSCAVEKVFKHVCQRDLDVSEASIKEKLSQKFEEDNYSLRNLFRRVALTPSCLQVNNDDNYDPGTNTGSGSGSGGGGGGNNSNGVVNFSIAAGTGNGAWNTEANPVVVSMGGRSQVTLIIRNDDATNKILHTNGTTANGMCPHGPTGAPITPGASFNCVIMAAAVNTVTCQGNNVTAYNHLVSPAAPFCIRVIP